MAHTYTHTHTNTHILKVRSIIKLVDDKIWSIMHILKNQFSMKLRAGILVTKQKYITILNWKIGIQIGNIFEISLQSVSTSHLFVLLGFYWKSNFFTSARNYVQKPLFFSSVKKIKGLIFRLSGFCSLLRQNLRNNGGQKKWNPYFLCASENHTGLIKDKRNSCINTACTKPLIGLVIDWKWIVNNTQQLCPWRLN